jgi:hypothetical protein
VCFTAEQGAVLGHDDLGSPLDRATLVIDLAVDERAGVRTSASPQYTFPSTVGPGALRAAIAETRGCPSLPSSTENKQAPLISRIAGKTILIGPTRPI